jgi:hypothetical protein
MSQGQEVHMCSSCRSVYHVECWGALQACAVCSGVRGDISGSQAGGTQGQAAFAITSPPVPPVTAVASRPATASATGLALGSARCACGAVVPVELGVCTNCGTPHPAYRNRAPENEPLRMYGSYLANTGGADHGADATTNTLAILSLVFGILGLVFGVLSIFLFTLVLGPAAIALGALAGARGSRMGWTGMALGIIAVAIWVIVLASAKP